MQYSTFYAGILFQGYIQKIHSQAVLCAKQNGGHPNDFLNYGYTLLRAATAPNRQFNRAPHHSLPAERHGQGVLGNLQSFRQHQGSEKMAQIPGFHPIFLIFFQRQIACEPA